MKIKGWEKFQHFKDRKPIWIKLYRDLLNDFEWFALDGDSSKCLIMIWLIASENDGKLPDIKTISFRIRQPIKDTVKALLNLGHWIETEDGSDLETFLKSAMYQSDIKTISSGYQPDALEKRREEIEKRKEEKRIADFQLFWDAFGLKQGKGGAEKAWKAIKNYDQDLLEKIIQAAKREAERRPQLTANGRTPKWAQGWLNERRWEDEPLGNVVSISASPGAARSLEIAARLRQERLDREATSEV